MPASPRRFAGRALAAAVALVGAAAPMKAPAERFIGADARYAYDDNLTRATLPADRLADSLVAGAVRIGHAIALEGADRVELSARAQGTAYARYSLLDGVAVDADITYRRKLGIGLTAPWLSFGVSISHDNPRDDIRDSDRIDLRIAAGRRYSERLDVSGGYLHERQLARHDEPAVPGISGALYDIRGDNAFIRAGYAMTERVLFDAAWRLRRGDVVATTPQSLPIFIASSAIAEDAAFGPERYGYRLRGTTRSASAALCYAIDERSSFNVVYTQARTRAPAGLTYDGQIVSASYVVRF